MNTNQLSDLQTKKYQRLFDLHDTNHDGVLEAADLVGIADKLAALKGLPAESTEAEALRAAFRAEWDEIELAADTNKDKVVSRAEWLAYMAKVVGDDAEYERRIVPVADMIIALVDDDGDGKVTAANWGVFFATYGIDTPPEETFERIDTTGEGKLDRARILTALHEYFYASDPSLPGNWFYGKPVN